MAGAMGFASRAQDERMFAYFEANEKAIFFEGQVRETPFPTQWTETSTHCGRTCPLHPSDPAAAVRTYQVRAARLFRGACRLLLAEVFGCPGQNGGYWATPHHHVLPWLVSLMGLSCDRDLS